MQDKLPLAKALGNYARSNLTRSNLTRSDLTQEIVILGIYYESNLAQVHH